MRKPFVLLTDPIHPEAIAAELKPHARIKIVRDRSELAREIPRAHALLCLLTDRIDRALLSRAPNLQVIGNFAVGVDNIDLVECARRGIRVVNTPDVLTRATAELALALLLAAARRIPEGEALCRTGRFKGWEPDLLLGQELRGKKAILVGRGRIGSETGRLFRALGVRVQFITRADPESLIRKKLRSAEILSFHIPKRAENRHWLDAKRMACLPENAIVINTARGDVIDENALIRALSSRRIFAAGLDVFEREPKIPSELRKLPNCVLLPHIGSATEEARSAMARLAARGVLRVLGGKRPSNEVTLPHPS